MLTSEDHRQLAERCIRLARECSKPSVAEYLMTLAADYLELAQQALIGREPATAIRRLPITAVKEE
jgi:preprotein translocase subunit Sss1